MACAAHLGSRLQLRELAMCVLCAAAHDAVLRIVSFCMLVDEWVRIKLFLCVLLVCLHRLSLLTAAAIDHVPPRWCGAVLANVVVHGFLLCCVYGACFVTSCVQLLHCYAATDAGMCSSLCARLRCDDASLGHAHAGAVHKSPAAGVYDCRADWPTRQLSSWCRYVAQHPAGPATPYYAH